MLPYTRQLVDEQDIAAVTAVLRSPWLTGGPTVERFEQAFTRAVGVRHAVACSSGTAALHLACLGLGLGAGDVAVVPAMTFIATANAPRLAQAEVLFTDVDSETGLMGDGDLARTLEHADGRTKAVLPVHLNGQTAPMEAIAARARAQGLAVIEDGCHALGTRYRTAGGDWATVGDCRFSDATVFSLHPAKTLTSGEGGVVCTNDDALARSLTSLRNHGMVRDSEMFVHQAQAFDDGEPKPWYYEMQALGLNYRLSDIHCALGVSQLDKLDGFIARRRELMARYDEALAELAPVLRPVPRVEQCTPALHLYPVLIDYQRAGKHRSRVMHELGELGVGTQVHYQPVHRQPYYRQRYGELQRPGADAYYERVLSLPFFPAMENTDVTAVAGALKQVLEL